ARNASLTLRSSHNSVSSRSNITAFFTMVSPPRLNLAFCPSNVEFVSKLLQLNRHLIDWEAIKGTIKSPAASMTRNDEYISGLYLYLLNRYSEKLLVPHHSTRLNIILTNG